MQNYKLQQELIHWLSEQKTKTKGSAYFVTITFSKTKSFKSIRTGIVANSRERFARNTFKLSGDQLEDEITADVTVWYKGLLRKMLGRDYPKRFDEQPLMIGFIDNAFDHGGGAAKSAAPGIEGQYGRRQNGSEIRLPPSSSFRHVHLVAIIPAQLVEEFEKLRAEQWIPKQSLERDPDFRVHIKDVDDLTGVISYARKDQSRKRAEFSPDIVLPARG